VAIKVLPAAVSADPDRLRRFEQEARSAGLLNHPNILSIYGFGEYDGAPYVVSELLEGSTLRDRMAGNALSPRRAIDYGLQVAQGLAAAHEKGIVHRDLKPENLFVTDDGRVKILDFGLAKLVPASFESSGGTNLPTMTRGTEAGTVLGTVGYMSPEQASGQPVDYRSDQFSFGSIVYELLTGKRLFYGETDYQTVELVRNAKIPPIKPQNPQVEPELEDIVRKLEADDVEGETFNIAGGNERSVLDITALILERLKKPPALLTNVADRPGHDRRYAIDATKLEKKTGFHPETDFARGIAATIDWYVANRPWWEAIRSGEFQKYYERTYGSR